MDEAKLSMVIRVPVGTVPAGTLKALPSPRLRVNKEPPMVPLAVAISPTGVGVGEAQLPVNWNFWKLAMGTMAW